MIEETVIEYLSSCLDVPVYAEKPDNPPESYVMIIKTGGGEKNHICRAMLAVQSYAGNMLDAARLNERVKAAMKNSIKLAVISKCGLNSDYNYTDTAQKAYRYQAVFDLVHY